MVDGRMVLEVEQFNSRVIYISQPITFSVLEWPYEAVK